MLPVRTRRLLDRIAAVDVGEARCDRPAAHGAIAAHLEALELGRLPVRWATDVADGLRTCTYDRESGECLRARVRARRAATSAAEAFGWRPPEAAVPPIAALWTQVADVLRAEIPRRRWDSRLEPTKPVGPHAAIDWVIAAAEWSAAPAVLLETRDAARWLDAAEAMVDAYEAGLGFYWVLADELVAVPRPAVRSAAGSLHCEDGPAIAFAGGSRYWLWHGVRVSRTAVENPAALDSRQVAREPNQEVRRVLLERMGYERYIRDERGQLVAEDGFGRLWRCRRLADETEPLVLVEVENASAEPDGSRRRYFLRVPPWARTPREAVAWTFGLADPLDYAPRAET